MDRAKFDSDVMLEQFRSDVVVAETPAGVFCTAVEHYDEQSQSEIGVIDDRLVLFVVSLFGVTNAQEELVSGDALLVRPKGTPVLALLASILDCPAERLPDLLARSGTWTVRELHEIDGHRIRFES